MKLRTFYIFKIKNDFYNLYLNNSKNLYTLLTQLYYLKRDSINYGFSLFNQLTESIDKDKLDRKIFIKYHKNMIYSKNGNDHIINNLYKNEVSILRIKKAYLLIESNNNYSTFFKIINELGNNYFICDFINQDYFWINDIKMLV